MPGHGRVTGCLSRSYVVLISDSRPARYLALKITFFSHLDSSGRDGCGPKGRVYQAGTILCFVFTTGPRCLPVWLDHISCEPNQWHPPLPHAAYISPAKSPTTTPATMATFPQAGNFFFCNSLISLKATTLGSPLFDSTMVTLFSSIV